MREIKFRVWDTKPLEGKSKMIYGIDEIKEFYDGIDLIDELLNPKKSGIPELIIMQFTGLKDKNGKDIFEGDIVKCFKRDSELNSSTGFKWISGEGIALIKNNGWGFYYKSISEPNDHFFYGYEGEQFYVSEHNGNTIEVIGNIYENPELLNKSTRGKNKQNGK